MNTMTDINGDIIREKDWVRIVSKIDLDPRPIEIGQISIVSSLLYQNTRWLYFYNQLPYFFDPEFATIEKLSNDKAYLAMLES